MKVRARLAAVLALLASVLSFPAHAIVVGPFPAPGVGGSLNGQALTIGPEGSVFELDTYVGVAGLDLNGGAFGTTAQSAFADPLPAGLDLGFASALSADMTDLTLSYTLTNNTGADLAGVSLFSYLDADISAGLGEFATVNGALAAGQSYEVDDPSGVFPGILDNLLLGTLDGVNALPDAAGAGNVAMALGFALAALPVGESVIIDLLISEDGDALGGFSITQADMDAAFSTMITFSGQVRPVEPIPSPGSLSLMAAGLLVALLTGARRRGADRSPVDEPARVNSRAP